jgi:hypothetical protein
MDLQWTLCPHCGNNEIDPYAIQPPESALEETEPAFVDNGELVYDDLDEGDEQEPAGWPTSTEKEP